MQPWSASRSFARRDGGSPRPTSLAFAPQQLLVALVCALVLAACGSAPEPGPVTLPHDSGVSRVNPGNDATAWAPPSSDSGDDATEQPAPVEPAPETATITPCAARALLLAILRDAMDDRERADLEAEGCDPQHEIGATTVAPRR